MEYVIVFIAAFLGSFIGGYASQRKIAEHMGKAFSRSMYRDMNDYMKKEEEALNEKIKRKTF